MTFKLYSGKSSVRKKNSRYVQGGTSTVSGRFIKWWERKPIPKDPISDVSYTIPVVYAGAPDLIAFDYYDRNDLGWLILQYNNIVDINEELIAGKTILLPSKDRVNYEFLTSTPSR